MKKSLFFAFGMIGQIGFVTAIPLVALALLGRYLDRHFGTDPYLFLSGILVATIMIYFILKKIIKDTISTFNKMN